MRDVLERPFFLEHELGDEVTHSPRFGQLCAGFKIKRMISRDPLN
jgi:hypothetical protein